MAGRPDPRGQEGMYVSSSPSSGGDHDPFNNTPGDPRYYDNDSERDYGRRDTYGSDSGSHGMNDDERYYDHNGAYDPYGREFHHSTFRSYSTGA